VRGERRLDLAELDTEAAHLDLEVDAAEELEDAVGERAHPVAGAYIRAPPSNEEPAGPANGSGTKLAAVSSGRLR